MTPSGSARHPTGVMDRRAPASPLPRRLRAGRTVTDDLFGLIRPDAIHDRPIPERHRLLFYLGHLEAFDRNLLCPEPLDAEMDRLFAFGIDPTDGSLPADRPEDWPSLQRVRDYARRARAEVDEAAARGIRDEPLRWSVAIEHRLMHAETLAYALHRMPVGKLAPGRRRDPRRGLAPRRPVAGRVEIPAGVATLGRTRGTGFGWDNEYDEHRVEVPAFVIDRNDVTNDRFRQFVLEGGYRERSFWSEEGWDWIVRDGIEHPPFWRRRGGGWLLRAMFTEIPLPGDWPVYVSHAEASAFARWAGRSLPTEAQYHRAAFGSPRGTERSFPWGEAPPGAAHGVFGMRRWDPAPCGSHPDGDSAFGVYDLAGNGWEWTSTPFGPFAGFEPFPFYPGYSADFFEREGPNGVHYVMKGGGPRTARSLLRRSFRNWFQPLYPCVHATFRCVEA